MWDKELVKKANDIVNSIYLNYDNVTPSKENALNFLKMDFNKIKVVIIGQDPYPTKGVANGYAFAVSKGSPLPQSLKNIFKELEINFGVLHTDETLMSWVNQGVLLYNTSLTTTIGKPADHVKLWKNFTNDLISFVDTSNKNIVWLLWGNHAKSFKKIIKNGIVIEDAHPSPLSVRHRSGVSFIEVKKYADIIW